MSRQSDRAYDGERPVEADKLERILEATRLAPSACNPDSKRVLLDIVIEYSVKEKRKKMRKPKDEIISYNRY